MTKPSCDFFLGLNIGGLTRKEIAERYNLTPGQVAGYIKQSQKRIKDAGVEYPLEDYSKYPESVEIKEDGTQVSDRLIKISEEERKDPRRLLELHNYDPDKWTIVHSVDNLWHMSKGWKLGGGTQLHYQSKITVRPNNDFSLETVQQWFEEYDGGEKYKDIKPKNYKIDGDILEVFVSDMHKGNRPVSVAKDIEEAFIDTITEIVARCNGKKFSKIVFVLGGDLAHFDTMGRTTTSGTQMTTNGQTLPEVYKSLIDLFVWGVKQLVSIAPVEVIHVPGNHDWFVSFAIANTLKVHFKDSKYITVDAEQEERKWRLFGIALIGFAHGDIAKKRAGSWLMVEAKEAWGKAKFAEVHMAHIHSQETIEENGTVIKWYPTMTGIDEWHNKKGFVGAVKATICNVWGLDYGLKEVWHINIL